MRRRFRIDALKGPDQGPSCDYCRVTAILYQIQALIFNLHLLGLPLGNRMVHQ